MQDRSEVSRVIADVIVLGHALSVVIPEGSAAELRRLAQARKRSVNRRMALYNQLQDLVFIVFPELLYGKRDRNVRIYEAHMIYGYTFKEIEDYLGIHYTSHMASQNVLGVRSSLDR